MTIKPLMMPKNRFGVVAIDIRNIDLEKIRVMER
jgi:hypothetical protein